MPRRRVKRRAAGRVPAGDQRETKKEAALDETFLGEGTGSDGAGRAEREVSAR